MTDINAKLLSTPKLFKRENDIIQWGIQRNIIGNTAQGTVEGQLEKTRQEHQEWKDNHSKDDLGDQFVTLVMAAALEETTASECVGRYFDSDNLGVLSEEDLDTPDGLLKPEDLLDHFAKEYLENRLGFNINLAYYVDALLYTAKDYGWTLDECIEVAWNDIKDRTGLMYLGMFIKQSNLDALEDYNIFYSKSHNKFTGTVYCSEDLQTVDKIFYNLGITYTNEGDYGKGVYIESTGKK